VAALMLQASKGGQDCAAGGDHNRHLAWASCKPARVPAGFLAGFSPALSTRPRSLLQVNIELRIPA